MKNDIGILFKKHLDGNLSKDNLVTLLTNIQERMCSYYKRDEGLLYFNFNENSKMKKITDVIYMVDIYIEDIEIYFK